MVVVVVSCSWLSQRAPPNHVLVVVVVVEVSIGQGHETKIQNEKKNDTPPPLWVSIWDKG